MYVCAANNPYSVENIARRAARKPSFIAARFN
jgi:hypothetical protein